MSDERLSSEEYRAAQFRLAALVQVVLVMDYVDAFERTLDYSLQVTPFLDPTLYMQKGSDAQIDLRMARAVQKFRNELLDIYKKPESVKT